MPDRLQDLQQQRARLLEVLKWLEQEIMNESRSGGARPEPAAKPGLTAASVLRPASPMPADDEAAAEEILAQYRDASRSAPENIRTGCITYFALALGLLIAAVVVWYLLTPKRH